MQNNQKNIDNQCYDADCQKDECHNPEHYNYICLDPTCNETHCEISKHYDKQLLSDFQKEHDLTQYDHREEIDYDEDIDIKICSCDDCRDDKVKEKDSCKDETCSCHDDDSCSCHDDDCHEDSCSCHDGDSCGCHDDDCHDGDSCGCHDDDCHEDSCSCHDDDCHEDSCSCHDEDSCGCHDESCSCHDDVDIKICNCDDCCDDDDDDDDEVIAEGKPLLSNRSIQIIVSSGILFVIGHILQYFGTFGQIVPQLVFAVGAIIAGYEIAIMAYKSLVKRHTISPALLMCIACVASFLIGHPEEGAAVTFLYFIAEFLEDYAEQRAKHSIKSLVEIAPSTATVKVGDHEEERNIDDVEVNEITVVKPGDKIPLDGRVISGVSTVNQASITGESVPVTKKHGDKVFAGTLNEDGYLEVKVTKKSKDSVISKIITLVKRSQLNRSHTETYVEKIAKYYTPAIIIVTLCVAFIPPLLFGEDLVSWVYRALSIMVISCPCAFLISTPIGMVSAITSATRQGVLIKGSTYVEGMRNVKAVIFDKTGTLTEGKLNVSDIMVLNDEYDEKSLIHIAASLENKSNHPIAEAICNYASENDVNISSMKNFKNVPGKGIIGEIDGKQYYAANESLIEGSSFEVSREDVHRFAADGKTIIFVGDEDNLIGLITVVDKIREESREVIASLKSQGIKTIMLTGDNKISARAVGEQVGVQCVYSDLLPEDKLNILDVIRNKFGDVAMVGDGINDAPALARANIGIAMGAVGSDVAIETADVALMQDDLSKLPYLFKLSNKTMSIIKQNIITAITVKVLFVILAILGLITLMMSVGIGDMGLTLLVILNSFRISLIKD